MPGIADAKPQIADYAPPIAGRHASGWRNPERQREPAVAAPAMGSRNLCTFSTSGVSGQKLLTIQFPHSKSDVGIEVTLNGIFFIEKNEKGVRKIDLPEDSLLQVNRQEARRLRRFGCMGIEVYAVLEEGGQWQVGLATLNRLRRLSKGEGGFLFVAPSGTIQISEIGRVEMANLPAA